MEHCKLNSCQARKIFLLYIMSKLVTLLSSAFHSKSLVFPDVMTSVNEFDKTV